MKIQYVNTDGVKGALPEGALGYDAALDIGRVAVGTPTGDVELAKKTEVDASAHIMYGNGYPASTLNPAYGVNTIYVDNVTKISYICDDATTNANTWIANGPGQFADVGTIEGRSVPYLHGTTATNESITVKSGQNSFAIDEIVIANGSELIIENNAVFKVL